MEDIKRDLKEVKGRVKTGRVIAQVIANYSKLKDMKNFYIASELGLPPSSAADIAKGKAAAGQLAELGYEVCRLK